MNGKKDNKKAENNQHSNKQKRMEKKQKQRSNKTYLRRSKHNCMSKFLNLQYRQLGRHTDGLIN